MVDEKPVLEKTYQIQNLVTRIIAKEILINERLQVPVLIDKLLPFWSDFQITLKHKREVMTLDNLMVSIQVKEKHQSKHKLRETYLLSMMCKMFQKLGKILLVECF